MDHLRMVQKNYKPLPDDLFPVSYHLRGHIVYSLAPSVVRSTICPISVLIYVTLLSLDYTIPIIFQVSSNA